MPRVSGRDIALKPETIISWLMGLFLLITLLTVPLVGLQNDDASLYALAAKNCVVHGQWLAQFVNPGDPTSFLDKPPVGIWLLAWIPQLIGVNEISIHLPNILYFLLFLGMLYWLIKRLADKETALLATLIASTSLTLVTFSRTPKLDILLTVFSTLAIFSFYGYLQEAKKGWLYLCSLGLALGLLTKSGFGLIIPGLTFLSLIIFSKEARSRTSTIFTSLHFWLAGLLFFCLAGGVLLLQAIPLQEQWLPYLKSLSIQSKYNTSYLAFGWHYSIIGFLLVTIFPWTPLLFGRPPQRSQLRTLALHWLWSNLFFLFFFYNQTDLRTFVPFAVPLSLLAGENLIQLVRGNKVRWPMFFWNLLFWLIFTAAFFLLWQKPYNGDGIFLGSALLPIGLFSLGLFLAQIFYFKPSYQKLYLFIALIIAAYGSLLIVAKPLTDSFNPDINWPNLIKNQRLAGTKFIIYRPPDRNLFYSPDLFYVDFLAGPADSYIWEQDKLKTVFKAEAALVLSDTISWEKLKLKGEILARDNYSLLVVPAGRVN